MKKILLALVLSQAMVRAEGLSFDKNGNLASPHSIIKLTADQKEEAVVLDSVTLTDEQWKAIRKLAPNTPKRLQGLLPITHRDCTCGVRWDAVQVDAGRIAVFHQQEQLPRDFVWRLQDRDELDLRVDAKGQFYVDGILVRFPVLLEAIQMAKPWQEKPGSPGYATIHVPMGMSPMDAVFDDRTMKVYDLLASKGWNSGANPLKSRS